MKRKITLIFFIVLCTASIVNSEQPLFLRDSLPTIVAELKLDESFKTNLFTGAFIYSYSIKIPTGTNGLTPEIQLFYANQKTSSQPSQLGTGWDFTQSFIQRDINATVNDSLNDRFILVLDGTAYNTVYGSDRRYHTETEEFLLIQNLSTVSNEKGMYWTVTKKDGTMYEFGSSNNTEQVADNGRFAWKWHLDKIVDTYNNTFFYAYQENPFANDNNATYLMNISYNNDKQRFVEFVYENESRSDLWHSFEAGNTVRYTRRVVEIAVLANNAQVRRYKLAYGKTDTFARSLLMNITEIGSDNTSALPPTSFSYNPVVTGFTQNTTWEPPIKLVNADLTDAGTRIEDINGDGLADVIHAFFDSASGTCSGGTRLTYINTGNGWALNSTWNSPLCFVDDFGQDRGTRLVDVNSDGLVDVVQAYDYGGGCNFPGQNAYINTGSGWVSNSSWYSPVCFVGAQYQDSGVRFADVNNDGRVDIIQYQDTGLRNAFINNGSGWVSNSSWYPPTPFITGSGLDYGTRIADVNSDGLVDIISYRGPTGGCEGGGSRSAYINTGYGWVPNDTWIPPICFVDEYYRDPGTRLADVNGDGLIDIIRGQQSVNGCTLGTRYAFLNNGHNWTLNDSWLPQLCFVDDLYRDAGTRMGDVNGDGYVDELQYILGSSKLAYLNNANQSYLLHAIKNSFGGSLEINYKKSTSLNNKGSDNTGDLGFNLWVVSSITQRNGVNGSAGINATYTYNYSGGKYEYSDKEFRGFSFVQEVRPDSTKVNHYFHQDKARMGREYRTDILDSSDNIYQRREFLWNYTVNQTSNGIIYITELREENMSTFDGMSG